MNATRPQGFKKSELEKLCSLDFHLKEVKKRFKRLGIVERSRYTSVKVPARRERLSGKLDV